MIKLNQLSLSLLILVHSQAYAKVHSYETTRLKSTAGAGVGSLLLNESAILNPSSLGFFNLSSIYIQKNDLSNVENTSVAQNDSTYYNQDQDNYGLIFADSNGSAKGSVALTSQEEGPYSRKRVSLGTGFRVSDDTTLGAGYRYTIDKNEKNTSISDKYHQFTVGGTYVITKSITAGVLYIDPLATQPGDSLGTLGLQYSFESFITLIGDIGADYRRGLSETLVYKTALQLSVFSDFYVRAGLFDDKGAGEKGNGVGASWSGPKLQVDAALKSVKPNGNISTNGVTPIKSTETAFSLSYRF